MRNRLSEVSWRKGRAGRTTRALALKMERHQPHLFGIEEGGRRGALPEAAWRRWQRRTSAKSRKMMKRRRSLSLARKLSSGTTSSECPYWASLHRRSCESPLDLYAYSHRGACEGDTRLVGVEEATKLEDGKCQKKPMNRVRMNIEMIKVWGWYIVYIVCRSFYDER